MTPVYIRIISTTRNTLFVTVGLLAAFLQKILRHTASTSSPQKSPVL